MKISDEYMLRKIFEEYALIPIGGAIDRGQPVLRLNETGYIIAKNLLKEISYEDLLKNLLLEFEVEQEEIDKFEECVKVFIENMKNKKILTIL